MSQLLPFIVVGIASGSVYGMAGVGLVLTYKTSGIFNFAHGALATVAAYVFYTLHVEHNLAWPLSALVSLGVVAVGLGFGLEGFSRRVAQATLVWRIVATVGVLLTIEAFFTILYGVQSRPFPTYLPTRTFEVGGAYVSYAQLSTILVSIGATAALYLLFRASRTGKAMRAVVDDPELLDLAGTSPASVRRWAWVLGCGFAALSGLLLAPSISLSPTLLTLLVVQAFGAAAIGGFTSLPITWIGGVAIGVVSSVATKYVNSEAVLSGLPASLPFIVLFVVLLVFRSSRLRGRDVAIIRRPPAWRMPDRAQLMAGAVVAVFLLLVPRIAGFQLTQWTAGLATVILFLSLGLLARTSGQVSLCHVTFAAIGAVAFSKLTQGAGVPWIPALLLCGLVVVPIGALVAIPAIRLPGLFLALATFGFGLLVQDMFYSSNVMFGTSSQGILLAMPHLSWLHVDTDTGFYYVVLAITAVMTVVTLALTRSRLGRLLRGLGDSPTALATSGTNVQLTRVLVFCISAYVAGIAGALLGMTDTFVLGSNYDPFSSLTYIVLIMIIVGTEPWFAYLAGLSVTLIPAYIQGSYTSDYLTLLFGVSAIATGLGLTAGLPPGFRSAIDRFFGGHRAERSGHVAAAARTAPAPIPAAPLRLGVEQLTVRFGGLVAVNDLSLEAVSGRITGLIGPNGAGKTTTFNVCGGLTRPTSGRILLNQTDVSAMPPSARAQRGLGRTFQTPELFESLTVAGNVALGCEAGLAGTGLTAQLRSTRQQRALVAQRTSAALEQCGLLGSADELVSALSTGQRRLVELARCLAGSARLLLLDEPSAGLDQEETRQFGGILRRAVTERGLGVLLVEHDMSLVMDVCDDIFVMDFGTLIFRGTPAETLASDVVRAAYLGYSAESPAELVDEP